MKVVALVSGGKDSCYSMMECARYHHEVVALANLHPAEQADEELDSFMYQTVGHRTVRLIAEALSLPLVARAIEGQSRSTGMGYSRTEGDEVEDLYELLAAVVQGYPEVTGVSVGAILSDYQRIRVEHVCGRLGLTSLAYLWRRDQDELLDEMVRAGNHAVLVKVAAMGLKTAHLGKSLGEMQPILRALHRKYDVHVCGEGGEYETITLDNPLFHSRLVPLAPKTVVHSDDAFAPVAYLDISAAHLELKPGRSANESWQDKVAHLDLTGATDQGDTQAQTPTTTTAAHRPGAGLPQDAGAPAGPPPRGAEPVADTPFSVEVGGPRVADDGRFVCLSNCTAAAKGSVMTVGEETQAVLGVVRERLETVGLGLPDIILVHLYVRSMALFKEVNAAYIAFFEVSPPARVCVGLGRALSRHGNLSVDFVAAHPGGDRPTKHMHVQSISRWAPANIGPYSQAVQAGDLLFMAGQIGLDPGTMQLPPDLNDQIALTVANLEAVLRAHRLGWEDVVSATCYSQPGLGSALDAHVADICGRLAGPGIVTAASVADALPRKALVEWHLVARRSRDLELKHHAQDTAPETPVAAWATSVANSGDIFLHGTVREGGSGGGLLDALVAVASPLQGGPRHWLQARVFFVPSSWAQAVISSLRQGLERHGLAPVVVLVPVAALAQAGPGSRGVTVQAWLGAPTQ